MQKIELHGQDIRNALQTAITLAEFETLGDRPSGDDDLVIIEKAISDVCYRWGRSFRSTLRAFEEKMKRSGRSNEETEMITQIVCLANRWSWDGMSMSSYWSLV